VQVKTVKISELRPHPKNPRVHPDSALDKLVRSIKEFGWTNPILVSADGYVIAGHARLKAAEKAGISEVPVIYLPLEGAKAEAYLIADNRLQDETDWDYEKLKDLLQDLDTGEFDLELTGFDMDEIEDLMTQFHVPEEIIEDEVPEPPKEPITKPGDLWILGRHRLLCGDATKKEDVERLMDGKKADMVFTDPPYGMKKEKEGVLNDNLNYDDLLEFNKKWIPLSFDNLKGNGSWYCWGMDEPLMDIYSNILKPMQKQNKITFRNLITWDKGGGQGQLSSEYMMYPIADEKCLFVQCGVQCLTLNADNYFEGWEPIRSYLEKEAKKVGLGPKKLKEITGVGMYGHWFTKSQWEMIPEKHYLKLQKHYEGKAFEREYDSLREQYDKLRAYFDNTHDNMNNVWHFDRTSQDERSQTGGHATPKPIALCSRAIKSSSREGEIVLDLFGGSGSTLIACEQLNRTCYMMEIDPVYCDVIVQRYINLKGHDGDVYLERDGNKIAFSNVT
jgi:DNA modification methylase